MKTVMELLRTNEKVGGFKINVHKKESMELFFVKGKLETVRRTNTCDKEVTVYVDHGEFKGDSQFFVYPSTTEEQLKVLIDEAVEKALLINNQNYELPAAEMGEYVVQSNFADYETADLAAVVSKAVFEANTVENASLNSVEVFINKHTETVINSNGLDKTQIRYDAMVEAIPTYNGESMSVELYEQYNFGSLNLKDLHDEIAGKMAEVKARFEAVKPEEVLSGTVILNKQELSSLFFNIASNLNFATVYSHSNLWNKGDAIQKSPEGDAIGITMAGQVEGSTRSSRFDNDGLSLGGVRVVEGGKAMAYYGSNRYGQYLGEVPTGEMRCLVADAGTVSAQTFTTGNYLEVVSMSGLQVDFYNDYIGGEVRLAYYHDGEKTIPVTGVSISGKLSQVLENIRFSSEMAVHGGYFGPAKAALKNMTIF